MVEALKSRPRGVSQTAAAIGRSLDIYYRDADRMARMDRLNAAFVQPGMLAFDLGAHVGDRTASFLKLGASVVTVEPQPSVFRALQLLYGREPRVSLYQAAVGDAVGEIVLHLNTANPTVSTVSPDLIAASATAEQWQGQVWDQVINVPVITIDQLIEAHGLPQFIKIDVEGHELAALSGLSQPVPALSFEFTTIQRDIAVACIDHLDGYIFNLSLGEEHKLRHQQWIDGAAMKAEIMALPMAANSGDIYARLKAA